jgi:dipeptidyl aminopeptidase/acylaminoacyl peptidase
MLLPFLLALAQGPTTGAAPPLTPEEYYTVKRITEIDLSANGRNLAFVAAGADRIEGRYRTTLFTWESRTGAQPLALAFAEVRSPRWSPDGEWLTFLAPHPAAGSADAPPRLWLIPRFADEPIPLGEFDGGVIDYGWAADGELYAIVVNGSGDSRAFWRIEVPGGDAELIWGGDPGACEMAISPDGGSIAFTSNGAATDGDLLNFDIWVLDLEQRSARRLTNRAGPELAPEWSPDGNAIIFRAPQNTRSAHSQTELFRVSATGGTPQLLTGAFDRSVSDHRWPSAGDLVFTAAVGMYTHLFAWRSDGSIEQLRGGAYNYGAFQPNSVGSTFFAVRESASEPPDIWRLHGDEVERLTMLNPQVEGRRLARQSVIQWVAPDGLAIEGLLIFPVDFRQGERYPLLLDPSRGRDTRARNVLISGRGHQLYSAQGYAVLTANVRGISGYGEHFLTTSRHDLAGGELADLLAGIDYLVQLGIADSTRLAFFADSDTGGQAIARAAARTRRFAAAYVDLPAAPLAADGPLADSERFFQRLRRFDRHLKFGGADNVAFYHVGEWVPGPNGWQARVRVVELGASYDITLPDSRFLELAIDFRPDPEVRRTGALRLDPANAVGLVDMGGDQHRAAGVVVADTLGAETLAAASVAAIDVPASQARSTVAGFRIVFDIPRDAAEYRLRIAGFAPVRIWAGTAK